MPCAKAARATRGDERPLLETAQPSAASLGLAREGRTRNHGLTLVAIVRGDVSVPV